ncbi:unnamed protein product [Prorocentrum cordatum]|uniref:Uncharacterized protein n=1 Tax=Prorocentrum cordatum TaxID=2364126 RepID=A0ABN9S0N5_9DINO|nr:unnamed protein product [Polarella glacialis]
MEDEPNPWRGWTSETGLLFPPSLFRSLSPLLLHASSRRSVCHCGNLVPNRSHSAEPVLDLTSNIVCSAFCCHWSEFVGVPVKAVRAAWQVSEGARAKHVLPAGRAAPGSRGRGACASGQSTSAEWLRLPVALQGGLGFWRVSSSAEAGGRPPGSSGRRVRVSPSTEVGGRLAEGSGVKSGTEALLDSGLLESGKDLEVRWLRGLDAAATLVLAFKVERRQWPGIGRDRTIGVMGAARSKVVVAAADLPETLALEKCAQLAHERSELLLAETRDRSRLNHPCQKPALPRSALAVPSSVCPGDTVGPNLCFDTCGCCCGFGRPRAAQDAFPCCSRCGCGCRRGFGCGCGCPRAARHVFPSSGCGRGCGCGCGCGCG